MVMLKDVFHFLTPHYLLIGTGMVCAGIIGTIVTIYSFLFLKKKRFLLKKRVTRHLEAWISNMILEESFDAIQIPGKLQRMLDNRVVRQITIDELIVCRKNFSGSVGANIVELYQQLGLKQDSINKIERVEKAHIKAKGIQELYLMGQRDHLPYIYKNTNNRHPLVRMESQTGIIHLAGFAGLRFLNVISYPLTEWQQIKLLEQLKQVSKKEDLSQKIPKWLLSKNESVVVFALKLADELQQFAVRDAIVPCLLHNNRQVRAQAIRTLVRLADEHTASVFIDSFYRQAFAEQVHILEALANMASNEHFDFLHRLLDEPDNTIKLKAAIVLASNCAGGWDVLEKRSANEPEPFYRILRHVQTA
jgi:hypothetical protein